MGGIGTLPMDYGQSLQVNNQSQMPMPNYSSAQNITSNPLLNYGQSPLADGGGTPLTMRNGGRMGYQEGGMGMMQPQMQQPQIDPSKMDPKQALEIIIQMLVAQGIPPEEARKIALQMVQAIAEGGMEEMSDQRIEARFGGTIRQQYGLGSIVKGIVGGAASAVKGVTNAVKSVVKSPIGKLALTAAAIYFAPYALGAQSAGLAGYAQAFPGVTAGLMGTPGTLLAGDVLAGGTPGLLGNLGLTAGYGTGLSSGILGSLAGGAGDLISKYGTSALISGAAGALGGALAGGQPQQNPGESNEDYQRRVDAWKVTLNQGLSNPTLSITNAPLNLYPNNPFYAQRRANGGRIGYGFGSLVSSLSSGSGVAQPVQGGSINTSSGLGGLFGGLISKLLQQNPSIISQVQSSPVSTPSSNGISDIVKQTTKQTYFGNVTPMYDYNLQDLYNARKENNDYMYAKGGRIGYAAGNIPVRKNEAGVKELDYRDTGGFVPPIGIKERADDIPAMLSNNEFVFTADAVRNAGGGDENLGAQRMYRLMKKLEHGGRV
jgi:hypothetical protein